MGERLSRISKRSFDKMKKSILVSLLATAGVAAYFVSKKLKPKDDYEEVMFVEIDDEEDEDF